MKDYTQERKMKEMMKQDTTGGFASTQSARQDIRKIETNNYRPIENDPDMTAPKNYKPGTCEFRPRHGHEGRHN